ncbi:uncharacterized protein LOC129584712 isoform X2 [Paramacrobiotus metropolitanus]|uniref:uncharacterized protein LOC129584712 isoform X2 n=1 Tax=Paramacrobiotus metropolitanus TaxID=2943436 RepID=UPI0024460624|nr:uncharacterized protein LOC129584712 isoform X2 [Paramacrobiotus metropolitanus]
MGKPAYFILYSLVILFSLVHYTLAENSTDSTTSPSTITTTIDPCEGYVCQQNAHCAVHPETGVGCECNPGYALANDSSGRCYFDPCGASACGRNATCLIDLDARDLRWCVCDDGFVRDVQLAETEDCTAPYDLLYAVIGVAAFILVSFTIWFCYLARRGPTRKLGDSTPIFKSNVVRIIPVDVSQIPRMFGGRKASDAEVILVSEDVNEDHTDAPGTSTAEQLLQTLSPEDAEALIDGQVVVKTESSVQPVAPSDDGKSEEPSSVAPATETVIFVPVDGSLSQPVDMELLSDSDRPAPEVIVEPMQTMITVELPEASRSLEVTPATTAAGVSDTDEDDDSRL